MEYDKIKIFKGNNKVVLLNKENMNWVRMSDSTFEKYNKNKLSRDSLYQYIDKKFNFFMENKPKVDIKHLTFSVTNNCNMNCWFCCMNDGVKKKDINKLSINDLKENVIPKLKLNTLRTITITGGEPLLNENIIEIVKIFSDTFGRDKIILQSNGLLLDKKIVKELVQYIKIIEISIEYLIANETYLSKLESILTYFNYINFNVSLSYVVEKNNISNLPLVFKLCEKYNTNLSLKIVAPLGKAANSSNKDKFLNDKEYIDLYKFILETLINSNYNLERYEQLFFSDLKPRRYCSAYGKMLFIMPDGDTYVCANMIHQSFFTGNIKSNTIAQIESNIEEVMNDSKNSKFVFIEEDNRCRDCDFCYFCSGICSGIKINNPKSKEIYNTCDFTKKIIKFNMFYYKKDNKLINNMVNLYKYLSSN